MVNNGRIAVDFMPIALSTRGGAEVPRFCPAKGLVRVLYCMEHAVGGKLSRWQLCVETSTIPVNHICGI